MSRRAAAGGIDPGDQAQDTPRNVNGWTIRKTRRGYFEGVKRVDGKLVTKHIGRSLDRAQEILPVDIGSDVPNGVPNTLEIVPNSMDQEPETDPVRIPTVEQEPDDQADAGELSCPECESHYLGWCSALKPGSWANVELAYVWGGCPLDRQR